MNSFSETIIKLLVWFAALGVASLILGIIVSFIEMVARSGQNYGERMVIFGLFTLGNMVLLVFIAFTIMLAWS